MSELQKLIHKYELENHEIFLRRPELSCMGDFTSDGVKVFFNENFIESLRNVAEAMRADIRNKLTPVNNLCAMLEDSELMYHHEASGHKIIKQEIIKTKQTIEYLSR